jgi:hypothetical protein
MRPPPVARRRGLVHGRHVLLAEAHLDRRLEAAADRLGHQQLVAVNCLQYKPCVLRRPLQREARLVVALDHHAALELGVVRVHRAALDHLEELPTVDPQPVGDGERLGQAGGEREQPVVQHELHPHARSRLAEPHDPRRDRIEDGLAGVERLVPTGGQHDQLPVLGGLLRPEHGGVDEREARPLGKRSRPLRRIEPDRAHLEPDRVGGLRSHDVVAHHAEHGLGVGEHRDHRIGPSGGITGARSHLDPVARKRLGLLAGAVPRPNLEAGPGEVPGNRHAHDSRADDGYLLDLLCHGSHLSDASPGETALALPVDRARRGRSGALYPQSALAGLNARPRVVAFGASTPRAALTARSRAMRARESGQVRKEAALSGSEQVPRRNLARASHGGHARRPLSTAGARSCLCGGCHGDPRFGAIGSNDLRPRG